MPAEVIAYVGRDATDEENEYRMAVEMPSHRRALAKQLFMAEGPSRQRWTALKEAQKLEWEGKVMLNLKIAAEISAQRLSPPPRPRPRSRKSCA